jgi:3-oxoacyl-(acyl-carrier-protein) synthase
MGGLQGDFAPLAASDLGAVAIKAAVERAGIAPGDVDAINGHLTATAADPREVRAWAAALGCAPALLPPLTATKSLVGHALGAAGGIEAVACVLMLEHGFLHASRNCEDLHPELEAFAGSIVREARDLPGLRTLAKASFGFGDVNACLVFQQWKD